MKINKVYKKSYRPLVITIIIIFLLSCGYMGFALKTSSWPFTPSNTPVAEPLLPTQDKSSLKPTSDNKNTGPATTPNQVPPSPSLSASITQLVENSDNNILFSATINGLSAPTNEGTCVVTFSSSYDKPYVKQFSSGIKGGETICGPLTISSLNFSYIGTWNVNLRFYLNNQQTTADGKIDIH